MRWTVSGKHKEKKNPHLRLRIIEQIERMELSKRPATV